MREWYGGDISSWIGSNMGPTFQTGFGPPDGLIAFRNAGLISYAEWIPVIRASHIASLPFAVTEYTEHSAELQRSELPKFLGGLSRRQSDYQIEMNPFQRPGQRSLPSSRLPNAVNGFTIVVWKSG